MKNGKNARLYHEKGDKSCINDCIDYCSAKHLEPSLESEIGDVIEIIHSGEILETYPARVQDVYSIRVVKEQR